MALIPLKAIGSISDKAYFMTVKLSPQQKIIMSMGPINVLKEFDAFIMKGDSVIQLKK